ncbi:MAG TPA: hypothetical protein VEW03_06550 [Longimicrobiaceae bacterium]|nr:hypothetical protein [Longimicrobiaceae bacterium]
MVNDTNLREAGRMIGRGREMVRKFIAGEIQNPHPKTREAIARLYVRKHGPGAPRVAEVEVETPSRTPLKLLFDPGLEKATSEVRAGFELFRRHAAEAPAWAGRLEKWLLTRLKDEYAAEVPYPRRRRPREK